MVIFNSYVKLPGEYFAVEEVPSLRTTLGSNRAIYRFGKQMQGYHHHFPSFFQGWSTPIDEWFNHEPAACQSYHQLLRPQPISFSVVDVTRRFGNRPSLSRARPGITRGQQILYRQNAHCFWVERAAKPTNKEQQIDDFFRCFLAKPSQSWLQAAAPRSSTCICECSACGNIEYSDIRPGLQV